jgi:hypothetical protein
MKYLELDARYEWGRKYARTLFGSVVKIDDTTAKLLAVNESVETLLADTMHFATSFLLPLSGLNLCPFIAMREGVEVDCSSYNGRIDVKLSSRVGGRFGEYEMKEYGETFNCYGDFRLALTPILANKYEGVRIVEVEE